MKQLLVRKNVKRVSILCLIVAILPIHSWTISGLVFAEEVQTETKVTFSSEAIVNEPTVLSVEHEMLKNTDNQEWHHLELTLPEGLDFDQLATEQVRMSKETSTQASVEWDEKERLIVIETTEKKIAEELIVIPKISGDHTIVTKFDEERLEKGSVTVVEKLGEVTEELSTLEEVEVDEQQSSLSSTKDTLLDSNLFDEVYQEYVDMGYQNVSSSAMYKRYRVTFYDEDIKTKKTTLEYSNEVASKGVILNPVVSIINDEGAKIGYISNGGWSSEGFQLLEDENKTFSPSYKPTGLSGQSNFFNITKMERANEDGSYDLVTLGTSKPSKEESELVYEMTMAPDFGSKTIKVNMELHNNTQKPISKGLFHGVTIRMNDQLGVPLHDLGQGRGMYMKTRAVAASGGRPAQPEMKLTYSLPKQYYDEPVNYSAVMIPNYNKLAYGFSPNTPRGTGLELKNNSYGKELVKGKVTGLASEETTAMVFKTVPRPISPKTSMNMAFNIGLEETKPVPELIVGAEHMANEGDNGDITGTWFDANYSAGGGIVAYKTAKDDEFQQGATYRTSRSVNSGNFNFSIPVEKLEVGANVVQLQITNKANQRTTVSTIVNLKKKITVSYINETGKVLPIPADYETEFYQRVGSPFSLEVPNEYDNYIYQKVIGDQLKVTEVNQKDHLVTGVTTKDMSDIKAVYQSKNVTMTVEYLQEVNGVKTEKAIFEDLNAQIRKKSDRKEELEIGSQISEHLESIENKFSGYTVIDGYLIKINDDESKQIDDDLVPDSDFTVTYYYQPRLAITGPQAFDFGEHKLSTSKQTVGLKTSGQTQTLTINNSFEKQDKLADWEVYVSSPGLYNATTKSHINGEMYYKEQRDDLGVTINHEKERVLTGDSALQEINLGSTDNQTGLLLDVENAFNYHKGTYEGEINWVLQVAP